MSSSSWFQEIPLDSKSRQDDETNQQQQEENKTGIKSYDTELESKINQKAHACCFEQYLIEKNLSSATGTKITILGGENVNNNHEQKSDRNSPLPNDESTTPGSEQNEVLQIEDKKNKVDEEQDEKRSASSMSELSDDVYEARKKPPPSPSPSPSPSPERETTEENNSKSSTTATEKPQGPQQEEATIGTKTSPLLPTRTKSPVVARFSTKAPFGSSSTSTMTSSSTSANLQVVLPEDAFLSPLPISTSTVSVFGSRMEKTNPNNSSSSNNTSQRRTSPHHRSASSSSTQKQILLRKLHEPQIQTLEVKNLPGFVVFADIQSQSAVSNGTSTVKTCGSSGRFLLLASYPLFDENDVKKESKKEEQEIVKEEEPKIEKNTEPSPTKKQDDAPSKPSSPSPSSSRPSSPSRFQQQRLQQQQEFEERKQAEHKNFSSFSCRPTGWRIVYFAPRNQQVKLRLVVLKSSCELIQKNLLNVMAFGSNFKVSSGFTRSCYSSQENNGNESSSSDWIVTCGGAGGSSFNDFVMKSNTEHGITNTSSSSLYPISFLRPIGVPKTTSDDEGSSKSKSKSRIHVTGFEAGWMHSLTPNQAPSNSTPFVWSIAIGVNENAKNKNETNLISEKEISEEIVEKTFLEPCCNLTTCEVDPSYNTSWSLSLLRNEIVKKEKTQEEESGDEKKDAKEEGCTSSSSSSHSITLSTGQLPASSPQVVAAKQKWNSWSNISSQQQKQQQQASSKKPLLSSSLSSSSSLNNTINSVELKGVAPEFWHLQRKLNSQNVSQVMKKRNALPNNAKEF